MKIIILYMKKLGLRLSDLLKIPQLGTSLGVQWLGLCASTAGGTGLIPG